MTEKQQQNLENNNQDPQKNTNLIDSPTNTNSKKPSLQLLRQTFEKVSQSTKPIAEPIINIIQTENIKKQPQIKQQNKKTNIPTLILLVLLAAFLILSLSLNLFELAQTQTNNQKIQDSNQQLANLSKRLGLTEGEIDNLNKSANSPNEIIQESLKSIVIIEKLLPAQTMEQIKTNIKDQYLSRPEDKDAINKSGASKDLWEQLGSGIILSKEGSIITNKHIVASNGTYRIQTFDGQIFRIERTMLHPYEDIAILEIVDQNKSNLNLKPMEIETSEPKAGDEIYALGHPAKLSFSVTKGIISNPERNFSALIDNYLSDIKLPEVLKRVYFNESGQDQLLPVFLNSDFAHASYLQHSADIDFGSSGGAIVNTQGKLLGINTFGIQKSESETYNLAPNLENPYQAINNLDETKNKIIIGYTPSSNFNLNGAIKTGVVSQIWKQYLEAKKLNKVLEVPYLGFYVTSFSDSQAALFGYPINYGLQISRLSDKVYNYDLPAIDPLGPAKNSGLQEGDILASVDGVTLDATHDIGTILSTKQPNQEIQIGYFRQNSEKIWTSYETKFSLGSLSAWNEESLKTLSLGNINL
jgi:S1-C subfamily serine protease